ncbi:MAG: DUF5009 domain-containing protein [Planctomycetota bacterium]
MKPTDPPKPARLLSLDAFRGLTIAAMLLVNNPGSWAHVYAPLRHAEWHGWTPTDLIFPFFLFIVGAAMAFSMGKYTGAGARRGAVVWRVARRVALLIGLGLLLNGFPMYELGGLRWPGVLQRIGLVYLLASIVVLWLPVRAQVGLGAVVLAGYLATLTFVPVEGVAPAMEATRNLPRAIDLAVIGEEHVWGGSPTDPEGLLSTLPATVTCLLGYWAGLLIRARRDRPAGLLVRLSLLGVALTAAGLLGGVVHPINKPLWTSSYVLLTGGLAMVCLAGLYWLIDVRGWRRLGTPAAWMGVNAILAFVGSGLLARLLIRIPAPGRAIGGADAGSLKAWVYESLVGLGLSEVNASLAFAVLTVAVWWVLTGVLTTRGVVLRV